MSKLSEAIDKAKREGQLGRASLEPVSSPSPAVAAAVEGATILPLTKRQRPERQEWPERQERPERPERQERPEHTERQDRPVAAPREVTDRHDPHDAPEEHMVSLVNPHSFEAEQFRSLRHLVEQCHSDADLRILVVTSATQGDGKSLVAVNLAGALAQNREARVLVVDCDLRVPSLHSLLGLRGPTRGVAELVMNPTLDLEDVLVARPAYNLTILQAGTPPASPYEVLKSERLANALTRARGAFDYVIIDTPPVLALPDTRLLGEWADAFLLVVGANKTPRKLVEEATRMLPSEKLLGLVFNGETDRKPYASYGRERSRPGLWRKLASLWGGN